MDCRICSRVMPGASEDSLIGAGRGAGCGGGAATGAAAVYAAIGGAALGHQPLVEFAEDCFLVGGGENVGWKFEGERSPHAARASLRGNAAGGNHGDKDRV